MTEILDNCSRLSWTNYEETVTNAFKRYLSSKWFCNVLLSAEGRTIPCHQELLSASSEWFEQVLSQLDHNLHPIILLKDVKYNDLQHVVNFIYNGQAIVPNDQVQGILRTANILQIKGLTNIQKEENEKNSQRDKTENTRDSVFFKNEELTVTTRKKSDAKCMEDFKIARKSSPVSSAAATAVVVNDKFDPETGKVKKRRIYENAAPVYDNRQIYAADLLQTQLDYSGDDVVMPEDHEAAYDIHEDVCPASGIENCGSFKKAWSNTYLCYNLGKEILCLLCFCRFTQFKKFNLERHMRKKHPDYYELGQEVKRKVRDELVGRYEYLVTPEIVASVPSQGNQFMVTDILQLESIEWSSIIGEELTPAKDEEQLVVDPGDRVDQAESGGGQLRCDDNERYEDAAEHQFL